MKFKLNDSIEFEGGDCLPIADVNEIHRDLILIK
jgi:hypothetical protein